MELLPDGLHGMTSYLSEGFDLGFEVVFFHKCNVSRICQKSRECIEPFKNGFPRRRHGGFRGRLVY